MEIVIREKGNKTIHLDNIERIDDKHSFIKFIDKDGYAICEYKKDMESFETE